MKKSLIDIGFDKKVTFVSRENRFLCSVKNRNDDILTVHVRDPGRLKEILYPGNMVLIREAENPDRKTDWDLIAGKVDDNWILVNSGFHREITETILEDEELNPMGDYDLYQAEKKLGDSRIDFLLKKGEKKTWVEVKGCTLAKNKIALFPDAPTKRGTRHVRELIEAVGRGDSAALIVLVFRPDAECFAPNEDTDPDFAEVFRTAVESGVSVRPLLLQYEGGTLFFKKEIPVCTDP